MSRRAGVLLVLWTFVGCGAPPAPENLLLVTLDTTRRDFLSTYGYERDTSPVLTRFAAEGVRFDAAYSASSTTSPSHATLFTSLHPLWHGVAKNGVPLAAEHVTLAERLRERGYVTGGIASSYVLAERLGWAQGFDSWRDSTAAAEPGASRPPAVTLRADETTDRAAAWLAERPVAGHPFFLFVHYFDPHSPYDPPLEWAERFPPAGPTPLDATVARYAAEIAFMDHELGRLLEALARLGFADDTLVVITADHGEGLMQHGHLEHGAHIYEEQVRVPLLLRMPGRLRAGSVITTPVAALDVAPTLLALLGVPDPEAGAQGRSLVPLLEGRGGDDSQPIVLFRRHYQPGREGAIPVAGVKHGIRVGDWKYIVGPAEGTRELYDLARDPGERTNQLAAAPERASALAAQLAAWFRQHGAAPRAPAAVSPEERERLRALGYVE